MVSGLYIREASVIYHKFINDRTSIGVATQGVTFDPNDDLYQHDDVIRYAVTLQVTRDRRDYAEADRLRSLYTQWGFTVENGKTHTIMYSGTDYDWERLGPAVPNWSGYAEWVDPDDINGRPIIDYCYHGWIRLLFRGWPVTYNRPRWPMSYRRPCGPLSVMTNKHHVHSVQVTNWADHPNLVKAKELGLPTILWSADGQATMESSTNNDWFYQQLVVLKTALIRLAKTTARTDAFREMGYTG